MLMSHLNKLRQLSWNDRWLLILSLLLLPFIHAALIVMGYSPLRKLLERLTSSKTTDKPVLETDNIRRAQHIAGIVSIAARRGLYKATCLRRSLLVWWFLRREGIPAHIRFGVRMLNGNLEAHAWLEYNGSILNDSAHVRERFQTLDRGLPSTSWGL